MELISDIEHATAVAGSVCTGVEALRRTAFWKIGDKELLTLAETLERVGRLVYAAQAQLLEPRVFSDVARQVALRCDPDGTLDEKDPVDTVELTLGSRTPAPG